MGFEPATSESLVLVSAGDITLSCVSFLPHLIKAAVVINCCVSSVGFDTFYKVGPFMKRIL